MNQQSEDKCDRELFSELLEPPIHRCLLHIVPPFIEENNTVFILQMNSEAAWRLREVYWPPQKVFELLQTSIMPLGYRLTESSCDQVGRKIGENIRRFKRRMETITNGKKEKNTIRDKDYLYDQSRRDQAVANQYISPTDRRKKNTPCNSGRPGRRVVQRNERETCPQGQRLHTRLKATF